MSNAWIRVAAAICRTDNTRAILFRRGHRWRCTVSHWVTGETGCKSYRDFTEGRGNTPAEAIKACARDALAQDAIILQQLLYTAEDIMVVMGKVAAAD